jgi:hypothetical protein
MRSALDLALDIKNPELIAWLRAQGGTSGEGPMGERHLASWHAKGWEGELVFRPQGSMNRSLKSSPPTTTGWAGSLKPTEATSHSSAAKASGWSAPEWEQWKSQNWDRSTASGSAAASSAAPSSGRWVWQECKEEDRSQNWGTWTGDSGAGQANKWLRGEAKSSGKGWK